MMDITSYIYFNTFCVSCASSSELPLLRTIELLLPANAVKRWQMSFARSVEVRCSEIVGIRDPLESVELLVPTSSLLLVDARDLTSCDVSVDL